MDLSALPPETTAKLRLANDMVEDAKTVARILKGPPWQVCTSLYRQAEAFMTKYPDRLPFSASVLAKMLADEGEDAEAVISRLSFMARLRRYAQTRAEAGRSFTIKVNTTRDPEGKTRNTPSPSTGGDDSEP